MVVRKERKARKFRGSKTHGWGAMKKHRGAGNRGGRGRAGSGKRGDAKKPKYWKDKKKKGFASVKSIKRKVRYINLAGLARLFPVGDMPKDVNLTERGIDKLLGTGRINHPVRITVRQASKTAIKKVKDAGGEVLQNNEKE